MTCLHAGDGVLLQFAFALYELEMMLGETA